MGGGGVLGAAGGLRGGVRWVWGARGGRWFINDREVSRVKIGEFGGFESGAGGEAGGKHEFGGGGERREIVF